MLALGLFVVVGAGRVGAFAGNDNFSEDHVCNAVGEDNKTKVFKVTQSVYTFRGRML